MHCCEACGTTSKLSWHHIVPRKVRVDNRPENLARLCLSCHALVERFYWRVLAQSNPWVARAYKLISQALREQSDPRLRKILQEQQEDAWAALLAFAPDWKYTYALAVRWVATVTPLREVHPRDAIMEAPWWKPTNPLTSRRSSSTSTTP